MTEHEWLLTPAGRLSLLSHLVPLGDEFFARGEQMKSIGLTAFQPLLDLSESFCDSAEEVAFSRRVRIEIAKERLGNFSPYPYLRDAPGPGYKSPLLQELRTKRAANGNSFESYDRSKPWLIELDPCRFREIELMFTRRQDYKARQAQFFKRHDELRKEEIALFATHLSIGVDDGPSARRALCAAVLEAALREGGFKKTKGRRAGAGDDLIEKPLTERWRLTWSVDFANLYQPSGSRAQDQHGFLDTRLELRPIIKETQHSQSITAAPLRLAYNFAAPIDATEWGYGNFLTLPELETLLRAHAKVYAMMSQEVEEALLAGLALV